MMSRFAFPLSLAISLTAASSLLAANPCCDACGAPCCATQTVERTVMVPTTVMEQRTVKCTQLRPEIREKRITVTQRIPQHHNETRMCTVMVPHVTLKSVPYLAHRPVWKESVQTYTAMVPHQVVKQGVRTVCKTVPVVETRTICEDLGSWTMDACGCRVWCSKIVPREVEVTVHKQEMVQEPYEYTVTVCKPEVRTRTVKTCHYVCETRTRRVACTNYVPKQIERTFRVTTFKCVPVEKIQRCTVMVPVEVEKVVQVPVCKMVPKTVTCSVPVCDGCP